MSVKFLFETGSEGFGVEVVYTSLIAEDIANKVVFTFYISDIRTPVIIDIEFPEYLRQAHPGLESRIIFTNVTS
jgi:hypothetical protein